MKRPNNLNSLIFTFVVLFLTVCVSAQTEQNKDIENPKVESPFPELENKLSNNDDEEICQLEGDKCWTRRELLEEIADRKNSRFSDHYLPKVYYLLGDYNSVFTFCNPRLGKYMVHSDCSLYRGFSYLKTGKYEKALEDFNCEKRGSRNNPLNLYGCGEVYLHQRKYNEAFDAFDGALMKNRRLSRAYFGRGIINLKRGEDFRRNKNESLAVAAFNDALFDFNSVIEIDLNRTSPETYQYRAKVFKALGYDFAAEADLIKFKDLSEKQ
jgi:tetratricopeptide (TPR) repeat protein